MLSKKVLCCDWKTSCTGGQGSSDQLVSIRPVYVAGCEGVLRSEERHASDTQLLLTLSYNGSPGCRLMLTLAHLSVGSSG